MIGHGRNILAAEDNAALAAVIRINLEHAGFKVTTARNGREAWEHLQTKQFDLLLTDHQMPEMSGCELCTKMREAGRWPDLPIVMLTAKGLELELPQLREQLGVKELVAKPFSPRELVATVENCLTAAAAL